MSRPLQFYSPQTAQALLMARQIRSYENLPQPEQRKLQQLQLGRLLQHAWRFSGFWQQRLQQAGIQPNQFNLETLTQLPVLTRLELQTSFNELRAHAPNLKDSDIVVSSSSGSTGVPVRIEKDARLYQHVYSAISLIEGQWHQRDPRRKIAVLGMGVKARDAETWGGIYEALGQHGPSSVRAVTDASMSDHLDWLLAFQPDYLKCSPNVAAELAELLLQRQLKLPLLHLISQWERIQPRHQALCQQAFGATLIDRYSCEEAGWLALQCPSHGKLHALNATVLIEIVDEAGLPCRPGKVGRVLVTALHSFAMPLIRYDIGDLASWGEPCGCGMTLPVIEKLWGRTRHQVRLPGGDSLPMAFIGDELGLLKSIREFRIYQYADNSLEIQVAVNATLSEDDKAAVTAIFHRNGLSSLPLKISQVEQIHWEPGRKREEFIQADQP